MSIDKTSVTLDSLKGGDVPKMQKPFQDTDPEIHQIIINGYRNMSPRDKLKQVVQLTRSIQQLALARIRKQYGNISELEQRLRLASLWYDRATMIKIFGWDPKEKGY